MNTHIFKNTIASFYADIEVKEQKLMLDLIHLDFSSWLYNQSINAMEQMMEKDYTQVLHTSYSQWMRRLYSDSRFSNTMEQYKQAIVHAAHIEELTKTFALLFDENANELRTRNALCMSFAEAVRRLYRRAGTIAFWRCTVSYEEIFNTVIGSYAHKGLIQALGNHANLRHLREYVSMVRTSII